MYEASTNVKQCGFYNVLLKNVGESTRGKFFGMQKIFYKDIW